MHRTLHHRQYGTGDGQYWTFKDMKSDFVRFAKNIIYINVCQTGFYASSKQQTIIGHPKNDLLSACCNVPCKKIQCAFSAREIGEQSASYIYKYILAPCRSRKTLIIRCDFFICLFRKLDYLCTEVLCRHRQDRSGQ